MQNNAISWVSSSTFEQILEKALASSSAKQVKRGSEEPPAAPSGSLQTEPTADWFNQNVAQKGLGRCST